MSQIILSLSQPAASVNGKGCAGINALLTLAVGCDLRFGIIEGPNNPEQSRFSEMKKTDVPSESDKQKLEDLENKPNDYQYKYKPKSRADTFKDKLSENIPVLIIGMASPYIIQIGINLPSLRQKQKYYVVGKRTE